MNLYDARSYFGPGYERWLADPSEVERQLAAHDDGETSPSVLEAIRVLAAFVQFMARARKQSKAAKTLAGQTILEFVFANGGTVEYGKLVYEVERKHRRTRRASNRMLQNLVIDGVLEHVYPTRYDEDHPILTVARV